MKIFLLTLSYLISAGELYLAYYFWKTHSGDQTRKIMTFFAGSTGLWVLASTVGAYADPSAVAHLMSRLAFVFGIMLTTGLALLSIVWPFPIVRLDRLHYALFAVAILVFSAAVLFTDTIVADYISGPTIQGIWIGGPLFNVYNVYLLALYLFAVVNLVRKFPRIDGQQLSNLKIVFWSILLGGMPAVVMELIVPLFTNWAKYPLVGVMSTVIWLGLTSYILILFSNNLAQRIVYPYAHTII